MRAPGPVTTIYWYGLNGEVLDESDQSGSITNEYVYPDGKRIARIVTDQAGIDEAEESNGVFRCNGMAVRT